MSAFNGKVAIVTGGGASGDANTNSIGDAICLTLARGGAFVAVVDIDAAAAEQTAAQVRAEGVKAFTVVADLRREEECARAVAEIVQNFGRVDVLVNNVGVGNGAVVTLTEEIQWDDALAINLNSVLFMCKHAIPHMQGGGAIVNLSTTAIDTPSASAAYSGSKAAVEGLSKHIALQFGPEGIRCNVVRPGEVWSAIVARHVKSAEAAEALRAERRDRSALRTEGSPWDIAAAVAFLASDDARWITGQILTVDGGSDLIRPSADWTSQRAYWRAPR